MAYAIQDGLAVTASSSQPFVVPECDEASFTETRNALLTLGKGLPSLAGAFGTKKSVDPVRHLIGTAMGWGGLPEHEATYINVSPGLPVGDYCITLADVPAKAFWSINMYNAEGVLREERSGCLQQRDGEQERPVTVNFGGSNDSRPNCLPITEGWNFLLRLYRPEPAALDGSRKIPSIEPAK